MNATDEQSRIFMRRALELAKKGWGQTHPNPMVGAVIVEHGQIVTEGWHQSAGQAHAEIAALKALGRMPQADATMYVTLEPCSTQGLTGACTAAILKSGIRNLVVGAVDPNPDHAGRGIEWLRLNGVKVTQGLLSADCMDLNMIFNHWIVQKQPFIALKVALTLDGKFAAASGQSKWVTGERARADVMQWRRYFPAIMVGSNTVLRDDPSLTSRIANTIQCPTRFVLDRRLKTAAIDPLPKLYSDVYKEQTIVVCGESADAVLRKKLDAAGVAIWKLPEVDGRLDLIAFRERCAAADIYGIYCEAGPVMTSELLQQAFVHYAFVYTAPKFMNDLKAPGMRNLRETQSMEDAILLKQVRHTVLEDDVLTRGYIDYT